MTFEIAGTYAVVVFLLIGAVFSLIGAIGLIKFNGSMTRLHAPTKIGTVGIGALLVASVLHSVVAGEGSIHQLLIVAFLFVSAPISAQFIAKVHIHRRACETPPKPTRDTTWATLDAPPDEEMAEARDARG